MRTRRRRTLLRILTLLLVTAATLVTLGFASPATALPGLDVLDCGDTDAPIPASPYGDGSFIARPSTTETELPPGYKPGEIVDASDPFRSPDTVSLESTYGTAYRWWVYEVGCTGKFVAGAGTSLANIELQVAGILPSWSHALLDTIIGDSDLFAALDAPVAAATNAVADGVWGPWLPISLLAVAALVLWRARSGHLGGAVTAATTALMVLGLSSFLMQYPTESVRWVDTGVRNITGLIASGFSEGKVLPTDSTSATQATVAVDTQMDSLVRDTMYRTWLDGVFGDPDSAIASQYGPRVFRATHFSFAEYAAYRSDPNGEGKEILEAKQAAFKEHAEAIKRADPVAYEAFTGKDWTSRATSALVNLLVVAVPCIFFLLAGLFALMGFVLIRLVVPLAPAAGVIFMYDKTRDLAIGWLKRVTGLLIMGPVCFLVALVLLRFTSAIFEAENMWFVVKLGLITVLTIIAFRLSGVLGMVPGYEQARRRITAALSTAVGTAVGAAAGSRDGVRPDEAALGAASPMSRAEVAISPGGVWHPTFEALAPSPPPEVAADFVPYMPPPRELGVRPALGRELGESGPVEGRSPTGDKKRAKDPKQIPFDPRVAAAYSSGDPLRPGEHSQPPPPLTYERGDDVPGWWAIKRAPEGEWMGFQEQISGVPRLSDGRLVEYCVTSPETGRPVSYDGHTYRDRPEGGTQEVFLESKRGYRFLAFSPDTTKSQRVKEKILDEADRQTGALPEGARLEWHVSDPFGAGAIRKILDEGGYFDIELYNTPEARQ